MAPKGKRIFSGPYSGDMWKRINSLQYDEVKDALYFVCCRIQELEARVEELRVSTGGSGL